MSAPVLVVGAGLAGLSAAYHLGPRPYAIVEAEGEAGGLCRSLRRGGFTFDYTGHLLHIKRPEIRELVARLVGEDAFLKIDRRSGIYSHGVYTEYPFQVNTHGLPTAVVRECVMGFAATLQRPAAIAEDASFAEWAHAVFGEGICKNFMIPYNQKLLCTDLGTVTADWVSWSIPKPTWVDVIRGALGQNVPRFGYNPRFFYPAAGGIDHLPKAFLPHVQNLRLGARVVAIDAARHEARLSTGEAIAYSSMISTMPLPRLVAAIDGAPRDIVEGAAKLRHVSVLNLNLGFDRPCEIPHHWVYFPAFEFPFYRIGVYSNLCPASVPAGCSSFYVEMSYPPGEELPLGVTVGQVTDALRRVGMISANAKLCASEAFRIPHAYVIHDRHRAEFLPAAHAFLAARGIASIGRYGAWEYSAMEDAIWHGKAAAESTAD